MAKDLKLVPVEKIDTSGFVAGREYMVTTEGLRMSKDIPGISGTFVRYFHGALPAGPSDLEPITQKQALSGQIQDVSLKTDPNGPGEIASRSVRAILERAPDDVYGFQILHATTLKGKFWQKARTVEISQSEVYWLGDVSMIEDRPVLLSCFGGMVELTNTDKVINNVGNQVWPAVNASAVQPPKEFEGDTPKFSIVK